MTRWLVLLASAAFVAACATQVVPTATPIDIPPSPTPVATDHPSGAADVILRMSVGGGLRYPGATVEPPPRFTLYVDGRVIYLFYRTMPDGSTETELRQARLTEEQIDQLLVAALDDGGLATASGHYSDGPYADDVTTTFEIHTAGIDKSVSVYGLGNEDESVPNLAIRRQMAELEARLANFGADVAAGHAEDLGMYEPEWYRVTLDHPFGELETNREWPWHDLEPDDFASDLRGFPERILTAEQAALIAEPPMSAPNDVVMLGPNGIEYLIRLLALLPDQVP